MKTSKSLRDSRTFALGFGLTALALAACSSSSDGYGYGPGPGKTPAQSGGPAVAITTPTKGGSVSGSQLTLRLRTSGFTILAPGAAPKDGEGHIHVYLDKPASSPAYDAVIKQGGAEPEATLPMPASGSHYLIVSLQQNDHSPYGIQDSIAFTVKAQGSGYGSGYPGGY